MYIGLRFKVYSYTVRTCKTCMVVVVATTIHNTASSLRGKRFNAVSG